jgi:hypothetical protein
MEKASEANLFETTYLHPHGVTTLMNVIPMLNSTPRHEYA